MKEEIARVLVVDDHHIVRSGISRELERNSDITVVGEASNGQEAISLALSLQPDVILLDVSMPDMNGIDVVEQLNRTPAPKPQKGMWPPTILVLSAYCDREYVSSLFAAGAKGYLLKDELPSRIVAGVRQVMAEIPALSTPVQKVLLTHRRQEKTDISDREKEVLCLIAKGHTNDEIAEKLFIAKGTVKNHVTNIYRKLPNVNTRAEAVAWAWENGLVK